MKSRGSNHLSSRDFVWATLLLLGGAACPGDDPSSCGYIGWNDASEGFATSSSDLATTVVQPTSDTDPGEATMDSSSTTDGGVTETEGMETGGTTDGEEEPESPGCKEPESLAELLAIDPPIAEHHGIFVHPAGDDDNPGTPTSPKATLQAAIDVTTAERPIVFLCTVSTNDANEAVLGPTSPGPVEIKQGVSIVGGMFCEKGVWTFPDSGRRTRISGLQGLGMRLAGAADPALIAHVELVVSAAPMNDEPAQHADPDSARLGSSAIGVLVAGGALDLLEVTITTDAGKPGRTGHSLHGVAAGVGGSSPAVGSLCSTLKPALPKCQDCWGVCDNGSEAAGPGRGGLGRMEGALVGSAGLPGETIAGGGQGGDGGSAGGGDCTLKEIGEDGQDGPDVEGDGRWASVAEPFGELSLDGYFAPAGSDGPHGLNGGAGGGGRGGDDSKVCEPPTTFHAPSGGGGGGGGCGGRGGVGGGSGGSSIAVVSLATKLRIFDAQMLVGDGGDGGDAGGRQLGASGRLGSPGLNNDSCAGGKGGDGSDGRFAGAGMGGHSIAIGYLDIKPMLCGTTSNSLVLGQPGAGGEPEPDAPVELRDLLRGQPGERATVLEF